MKTKQQTKKQTGVLYTLEAFSEIGWGKELERLEVTRDEYRALKQHLASMRAAKRAA